MNDALHIPTSDGRWIETAVAPGAQLAYPPRWTIVRLHARPRGEGYDAWVAGCIGSSELAGDEYLFDRGTLLLSGISWRVPEFNLPLGAAVAQPWRRAPSLVGLPRLSAGQSPFAISAVSHRAFDPDGDALFGLFEGGPATTDPSRLRIAPDLDLLLAKPGAAAPPRVVGWALEHATAHLAPPATTVVATRPVRGDRRSARAIGDFLALVDDPFVERMEDGDEGAREALRVRRAEVTGLAEANRDGALEILGGWIDDLLERFYG